MADVISGREFHLDAAALVRRTVVAQGLNATVDDPVVLERIATLLRMHTATASVSRGMAPRVRDGEAA
jgi:hypothetical protein